MNDPRRLAFPAQVALGFCAPFALVLVFALVRAVSVHGHGGFFAGTLASVVALVVTALASVLLWSWSGRSGWKGVRVGIALFAVALLAAIAGCLGLLHRLAGGH